MREPPATPEDSFRRFCAGDQSAFDAIMEEFQRPLVYFLNGYVHNLDTAEDLAEDTFVELLVHRERYRFQSALKTYLFSVARHKAIDHLRRAQRHGSVGLDEIAEFQDEDPAPEEALLREEEQQAIRQAMQELPQAQSEVLRLLYVERLSYDDVAKVLRKNKKQVDNLAYRARQYMRTALGKEDLFEERS